MSLMSAPQNKAHTVRSITDGIHISQLGVGDECKCSLLESCAETEMTEAFERSTSSPVRFNQGQLKPNYLQRGSSSSSSSSAVQSPSVLPLLALRRSSCSRVVDMLLCQSVMDVHSTNVRVRSPGIPVSQRPLGGWIPVT
ncbi:Hypothetical predicted protein [Xyrichtys novacula]|uniref:Uncharacterized protein n=1 Tax=Xyrichtys novacula TaxID=13765 RepID=A0AAV1GUK8_XYRNO|nr:Hypothetical predicted protein [Xyrichtys novacula]